MKQTNTTYCPSVLSSDYRSLNGCPELPYIDVFCVNVLKRITSPKSFHVKPHPMENISYTPHIYITTQQYSLNRLGALKGKTARSSVTYYIIYYHEKC
jgi:hypothetical protein